MSEQFINITQTERIEQDALNKKCPCFLVCSQVVMPGSTDFNHFQRGQYGASPGESSW